MNRYIVSAFDQHGNYLNEFSTNFSNEEYGVIMYQAKVKSVDALKITDTMTWETRHKITMHFQDQAYFEYMDVDPIDFVNHINRLKTL